MFGLCSHSNAVLETVSRAVPLRSCRFDSFQRPVRFASDRMIFYMVPIFAHHCTRCKFDLDM